MPRSSPKIHPLTTPFFNVGIRLREKLLVFAFLIQKSTKRKCPNETGEVPAGPRERHPARRARAAAEPHGHLGVHSAALRWRYLFSSLRNATNQSASTLPMKVGDIILSLSFILT